MNPLFIAIIIILAIAALFYKLNQDLLKNKDNVLRGLASIDKQLIKRNNLLPIILSIAQENMPKETTLIKDIYAFRAEVLKIKNRWDNADKRFKLQEIIDEKLNLLILAMPKYPELKSNFHMSEALKDLAKIEKELSSAIVFYNNAITALLGSINNFPSSILAAMSKTTCNQPYYNRIQEDTPNNGSYFNK